MNILREMSEWITVRLCIAGIVILVIAAGVLAFS